MKRVIFQINIERCHNVRSIHYQIMWTNHGTTSVPFSFIGSSEFVRNTRDEINCPKCVQFCVRLGICLRLHNNHKTTQTNVCMEGMWRGTDRHAHWMSWNVCVCGVRASNRKRKMIGTQHGIAIHRVFRQNGIPHPPSSRTPCHTTLLTQ